jgi:anti-sigma B factor antagonist
VGLIISRRDAGDVTILSLQGYLDMDVNTLLRTAIRNAIDEGRNKIVLNLSNITYIKSSGIGELVSSFTKVRAAGGTLFLCGLTKRAHDLLSITKLFTVFDVSDDEEAAIAQLRSTGASVLPWFFGRCPLNACSGTIKFVAESREFSSGTCHKCESVCEIGTPGNSIKSQTYKIRSFSVPTFAKGNVCVKPEQTWEACLSGPLEMFSVDILENVWRSIPPPRPCIFEISTNDVSEQGITALLKLCAGDTDGKKVAVVTQNNLHWFPPGAPVYLDKADAAAYLDGIMNRSEWNITLASA